MTTYSVHDDLVGWDDMIDVCEPSGVFLEVQISFKELQKSFANMKVELDNENLIISP